MPPIIRNKPVCTYESETSSDTLSLKKITTTGDETNTVKYFTYTSTVETRIFKLDVKTYDHTILDVKTSAAFIVNVNKFKEGSGILRLKINDTLIGESEAGLINNGYVNTILFHTFEVEKNGLYTVEVFYEGLLITTDQEIEDPKLHIRKDGAQISIMLI